MDEANRAVVRSLPAAFHDGDLDRAVATVTDDFKLVDVAAGQTFGGPAGLRQWLQSRHLRPLRRRHDDASARPAPAARQRSGARNDRRHGYGRKDQASIDTNVAPSCAGGQRLGNRAAGGFGALLGGPFQCQTG